MCRIPETSSVYHCKEIIKRRDGHNLKVSVWKPTAIRYGRLAAVTSDKRVVVSHLSHSYALQERRTSGAGSCMWEEPQDCCGRSGQGKGHGNVHVCLQGEQRTERMDRRTITAEWRVIGIQG